MLPGFRLFTALCLIAAIMLAPASAQPVATPVNEKVKPAKPFRILTSGKSVTIKSTRDIRNIMVWTSGGHRFLEQKDINSTNYSFRVTVNAKVIYVMVQLVDGKTYSEKIGVQ